MYNLTIFKLLAILVIFGISCPAASAANSKEPPDLMLWYDRPAGEWDEALPVGNGRLGAMVFGRSTPERIQVNEESLWGGSNVNNNNPGALENLPEIRRLILDGRIPEAKELADEHLLGDPWIDNSYRTFGEIYIDFGDDAGQRNYRRDLDLRKGIAGVQYDTDRGQRRYEVLSSAPDDVVAIRLATTEEGGFRDVELGMSRPGNVTVEAVDHGLTLTGQVIDEEAEGHGPPGEHMRFASRLMVSEYDGTVTENDTTLVLNGGESVTLLYSAATDYDLSTMDFDRSIDPLQVTQQILSEASGNPYETIRSNHIADHRPMMDRVVLDLGGRITNSGPGGSDSDQSTSNDPRPGESGHDESGADKSVSEEPAPDESAPDEQASAAHNPELLPTDRRLERLREGKSDPALKVLYFQYGRYLLMGSSRAPGVLPANLQGIWNEHIRAPWGSDYHVNINIQMNYWPANVTNLDETVPPLVDFMTAIAVPGEVTARDMYGAGGWTMHHTTDIFGKTAVMDGIHWGMFPLGGAWMMFPIYRHYEFTRDTTYLLEQAYPLMRGSAEFILDFLVEDDRGRLVTVPSYSPENSYILPQTGEEYKISYGPTMDVQIIRELFGYIRDVADITGEDEAFLARLDDALERMPEVRTGSDGTIMEWIEDYEEAEPGHRHISHLLGLHPGSQITGDNPEMFEAARRTIERRLEHGGGHTGWSRAWIINLYARLFDGEEAHRHLRLLLEESTLPNLLDTHPPFQIDGNFGGTAGITEMLLQSHAGYIELLPALPAGWENGRVSGLKARGNFEIDMAWEDGELSDLQVISHSGLPLNLVYGDRRIERETRPGEVIRPRW